MEILILLGLIVLNGVFAMSEIAVVTARKARLEKWAEDGRGSARAALALKEDPTRFLSTVQIGITSIGILNGIFGESILAEPFSLWLMTLGVEETTAGIMATAIVVVVVTYVSIVVGELVPKRLGQLSPEIVACIVARPMAALAGITRPFVVLLSMSTHGLIKIMGIKHKDNEEVTEEEIHAMLAEGSKTGVIEHSEHAIVRNVFRLDDRQLGSLMIPRSEVVYLDINLPPEENVKTMVEADYSRFPVCDGGLDKILGVIHAKQVLVHVAEGKTPNFTSNLRACVYVPETLTGMELMEQFRANDMQMVFVVDEYGEFEGMVTLQDLLEALTGEFATENIEDAWAIQREDGSWLLDGAIPIPELKDRLNLKDVPEEDKGRYHTMSGMMLLLMGRIPTAGDAEDWGGWRFEVVDMDDRRIDKVLASRLPEPESDAEGGGESADA